jgi:hypothetical protein
MEGMIDIYRNIIQYHSPTWAKKEERRFFIKQNIGQKKKSWIKAVMDSKWGAKRVQGDQNGG